MNLIEIRSIFCLVSMFFLLIMSISTNDIIQSQLFASLGIISGALTLKSLSEGIPKSKPD